MITRYLKRQKVIQRAAELQKPAPVFRRLYASLGPGKAIFPPSQRHLEQARLYLRSGNPLGRDHFMLHARQFALGSAELPSIWLAVLLESVNRDAKELVTFRGVREDDPGLEVAPPVAYSGSPYISPGNLERLSQAESRTRLTILQQDPQPEAQRAGGREDRFSRLQDIMRRKHERQRHEQAAWRAALLPMEVEVPEPVDDTQVRTDEYPQPEAQRADGREDRFSRIRDIMLRKLERERHEQAAWRAASLSTEVEVPDPLGAELPPLEPVGDTPTSNDERPPSSAPPSYSPPSGPGRHKRFPTEGETTIDLSDEEGEDVESLAAFIPPQQAWPAERGTLLRPLTQVERAAASAIQADPAKFGRETEACSLFGSEHYSGAVIDNLVPKLTRWAKELTLSDNSVLTFSIKILCEV